jgi:cyclophilin family peptidyl-prolyl cis-trans isomerase
MMQPIARLRFVLVPAAALAAAALSGAVSPASAQTSPGAGPIVVVETSKGAFEFETYPDEAPKSVEHLLALVKRNFYSGLRVHRMEPNFVVQFGDRKTRDMTKRDVWGRGPDDGSGKPVGVAEISKKRLHVKGAVGMAHSGDPTKADSQIYITLADKPNLNGRYAVIGKVISGMDVVSKLVVTDVIKRMTVK